jgi:hypothetical protein
MISATPPVAACTNSASDDHGVNDAIASLLSAKSVRERASELLRLAERGELEHFTVDRSREVDLVNFVVEVLRARYPDLKVPLHSRWRHFEVAGQSRWPEISRAIISPDPLEPGRVAFELAITSVLLDAGAGSAWRYIDRNGLESTRSEGLALASFDAFANGLFSASGLARADAEGLRGLDSGALASAFQVRADNPLVGMEGRARLLRALGDAVAQQPAYFATPDGARLGGLCDYLIGKSTLAPLRADDVLNTVLLSLGRIWPGRLELAGTNLGDVWHHAGIVRDDITHGLMPFHKLSQWLTYSLLEPLEWVGVHVGALDGLTGLAEYRNGGLLIDMGLVVPRDGALLKVKHQPHDGCIVEWRALTVALLDELAEGVRTALGVDATALPLASVLEGGTWAAGRALAQRLRAGLPPLQIESDGTVF